VLNKAEIFSFKQFDINQGNCAMKVGTDSTLLGSLVPATEENNILDIGCGTGILALMMAQKSNAMIDAIEIDYDASSVADDNFKRSNWKERLRVFNMRFQKFAESAETKYDLIISNPPFFNAKKNSLIIDEKRALARHDKDLSFGELIFGVNKLLAEDGIFWLILPVKEAEEFIKESESAGLNIFKKINIKAKYSKPVNRVIICFVKECCSEPVVEDFIIYNDDGSPTKEYINASFDFLLWKEFS